MKKIVILDYSPAEGQPAQCSQEGKFLQLVLGGREYLVFAPRGQHRYHNQILGQFLADNGIAHHWVTQERLELDSREASVIGGGRFRVDNAARVLELWDNSQVYGRFEERGLAEKIALAGHPWSVYGVTIH